MVTYTYGSNFFFNKKYKEPTQCKVSHLLLSSISLVSSTSFQSILMQMQALIFSFFLFFLLDYKKDSTLHWVVTLLSSFNNRSWRSFHTWHKELLFHSNTMVPCIDGTIIYLITSSLKGAGLLPIVCYHQKKKKKKASIKHLLHIHHTVIM